MILETNCKYCGKEINVKESSNDRAELSFKKGTRIKLTCNKCLKIEFYHPNEIIAKKSKIAMIIGLLAFVISIILISLAIGNYYLEHKEYIEKKSFNSFARLFALLVIPVIVYQLIIVAENRKIRTFNNYKIKNED